MPKGSNIKKGMRPGGRQKNTPNKATTERAELARLQNEESRRRGIKLGKEVLEEFMLLFAGMAASHQPLPRGVVRPGHVEREEKFLTYARLTVETAKALAEYQSPKFRAIMVTAPPPEPPARTIDGNVTAINDPVALARVYQQMVKRVA